MDLDFVGRNAQQIYDILTHGAETSENYNFALKLACKTLKVICNHELFFGELENMESSRRRNPQEFNLRLKTIQRSSSQIQDFLESERQLLISVGLSEEIANFITFEVAGDLSNLSSVGLNVPLFRGKLEACKDFACQNVERGKVFLYENFHYENEEVATKRKRYAVNAAFGVFGSLLAGLNNSVFSSNPFLSGISTTLAGKIVDVSWNANFGGSGIDFPARLRNQDREDRGSR